ncbi:bacteriocin-like protein [Chryseobacterium aquaticum]|uniref:bacteriocin-like protein n=1 Tax=Chryseobacterium aquaticum TaxID=452084 RepID=UPI003F6F8673
MKDLKKISRENLKSINGGIDNRKKCCARDNCGSCVYWVSNNQLCPSVIIPAC